MIKTIILIVLLFISINISNTKFILDSTNFDDIYNKKFMNAIAFSESCMKINIVNSYGMLGKYQFSRSTLNGIGFRNVSTTTFLNNETLQDSAMMLLLQHNNKSLSKLITKYNGKTINGIEISHSGILAGAHLAGTGGMKRWLESYGRQTTTDGYGTKIETYMKKFANYKIKI